MITYSSTCTVTSTGTQIPVSLFNIHILQVLKEIYVQFFRECERPQFFQENMCVNVSTDVKGVLGGERAR
jgi:hypothetical protein